MSVEQNKDIVRRNYDTLWNQPSFLARQADAAGLLLTLHLKRLPEIGAALA